MTNALEVVKEEPISPMSILQIAVSQGQDVDKLTKLIELQERFEANVARKAYYAAMKLFKDNAPNIKKNGIGHNNAKYATLDHACELIIPALAAVGITHKWPMKVKDGKVILSCLLTHELGYSDPDPPSIEAAADTSGGKNPIQALGSSIKYLERYTLFAATGLDDGSKDDDGAAAGKSLPADTIASQIKRLTDSADLVELQRVFQEAYKLAGDDKNAVGQFIQARDARKAAIKTPEREYSTASGKIADEIAAERLTWIADARDKEELTRIFKHALKMAKEAGDAAFEAQLVKAANGRMEAIRAGN